MKIKSCRICNKPLVRIFNYGKIPAVNYYPSKEELAKPEKKYTLNFCICPNCTLGQLDELLPPKNLFVTYHYSSSVSKPLKLHLEKLADLCSRRFKLSDKNKVLDIGCNDGTLLKKLKEKGISTLGIDPAKNIIKTLGDSNIPALADFFSLPLAKKIVQKQMFDVIFSTNTLAQIIDISDFMRGAKLILKKDGVFIAEVGYLLDMINKKTFDSIYHEHYSYFSLRSLQYLFEKEGLTIFDAQRISNHGGSLRIFAEHTENKIRKISKRLNKILEEEKTFNLNKKSSYQNFIKYCSDYKIRFKKILVDLKQKGKKIAAVTSPAKGVVLLNFCGFDGKTIDFIVDSTPSKQYRFMPGTHIPVFPEDELKKRRADYLLILAWTYKKELMKKLLSYRKKGINIIIPFPKIKIVK